MAHPLCLPDTWLNRNLEMTVLEERGKLGKPGYMKKKTSRSKGENQKQTQPTNYLKEDHRSFIRNLRN